MARQPNQVLESVIGAMVMRDAGMVATLERLQDDNAALTAKVKQLETDLAALKATQEG